MEKCAGKWLLPENAGYWQYYPELVMITQVMMALMLHLQIEPQANSAIKMMKFALNHPKRFTHSHYLTAFLVSLIKVAIVISIEVMNMYAMLVKCNVIDCVTGYLRYYAIVNFDSYMIASIGDGPLIAQVIGGDKLLVIDRTTSWNNTWALE